MLATLSLCCWWIQLSMVESIPGFGKPHLPLEMRDSGRFTSSLWGFISATVEWEINTCKVPRGSNVLRFLIRWRTMWCRKQFYLSNKHVELESPAVNRNLPMTSQATTYTVRTSTCSWLGHRVWQVSRNAVAVDNSFLISSLAKLCGHKSPEDWMLSAATSSLAKGHSDKDSIGFGGQNESGSNFRVRGN